MATIVAQANGNFSDTATWAGGVVPGAGDTAQTGNYIVTIDASVTCTLNPTGSGYFQVTSGGITITGDLVMQSGYVGGGLRCIHTSGEVTLTGTATGGAGSNAYCAYNVGTGTLTVGTATGGIGSFAFGAYNAAAGTLICDLAIGSNWGPGGTGSLNSGVYGSGAVGQTTKVKRVQSGAYGAPGIWGFVLIEPDAANSAQFRLTPGGSTLTLVDAAAAADFPAVGNVRYGVEYDLGDKVGTCAVPAAGQVAYGVPVDDTTGTAVLTAAGVTAAVWDAARSGYTADGTFGDVAEWAGSVDEAAIADTVLSAMDADPPAVNVTYSAGVAVSSRLAEAVDLPAAAPTADVVADAVWDEMIADHAVAGSTGEALDGATAPTAAAIWSYVSRTLTATPAQTTDGTTASAITRKRGNSWSISLTLGALTGYTSLWFTVKRSYDDADSAALVQIKLNASGLSDGLLTVNGAAATNDALGSITVSDATTGAIVIALDETVTDDIAPGVYYYDAQALISGDVSTPDSGTLTVTADVTRSVA